jgi:hypothetical protein
VKTATGAFTPVETVTFAFVKPSARLLKTVGLGNSRRATKRVGKSEGRSPSDKTQNFTFSPNLKMRPR